MRQSKDVRRATSTTQRYLWQPGSDQLLADEVFDGTDGELAWAALDHLGSVNQLVNAEEGVVEHRDYDSFGNLDAAYDELGNLLSHGLLASDVGHAGRFWDTDLELYQSRARWYDPHMGRFISEDPIGFADGPNPYRYAGNNPTLFIDPSGLFPVNAYPLNGYSGAFSTGVVASDPSLFYDSSSYFLGLSDAIGDAHILSGAPMVSAPPTTFNDVMRNHFHQYATDPSYHQVVDTYIYLRDNPIREDDYGSWSGRFKDNEEYYREKGGFTGAIGSIVNGTLVGPTALVDMVPRKMAEDFAEDRERIIHRINTTSDPVDAFFGQIAVEMNYFGETVAQASNAVGASAPILATGAISPTAAAVFSSRAVVGVGSGIGLLESLPTAIENYKSGNLSGTDIFYVIGNAIGLGYSLWKPTGGAAPETKVPDKIFRGGRHNDSAAKDIRVDADGVSFRDSLSNPMPTGGKAPAPVLRPGKQFIEVDTSKLPPGTVDPDNNPPGHVTVTATVEEIVNAITGGGKFPKK